MSPGADAGMARLPHTDPDALARLERFGGRTLLHEMIDLYLKHAPDRLSAAAAGIEASDPVATENALHALRSSSAQLGAIRLAALCEEGEAIARAGSVARIAGLIEASRKELVLVESWLNAARAERPA